MAFNEEEQKIIEFGKANGKSSKEIIAAVAKFRSQQTTTTKKPSIGERIKNRFSETVQDVKEFGSSVVNTANEGADRIAEIDKAERHGDQGAVRSALQKFTVGAGTASRIIGDTVAGGAKALLSQKHEEQGAEKLGQAVNFGIDTVNTATNVLDQTAGRLGSALAGKDFVADKADIVKTVTDLSNQLKEENPALYRDIRGVLDVTMLALDIAGIGSSKKVVTEGMQKFKNGISKIDEVIESKLPKSSGLGKASVIDEPFKEGTGFFNNPTIAGTMDDIKIRIGLDASTTPSVDYTFRAIKPKIKKGVDPRRVKAQMALANDSIVANGFKPTTLREYSDAIFDTKKIVWKEIQENLDAGQLANLQIELKPIANQIMDMANDEALLRTNPNAAKQLIEISNNLIKNGDTVDILTAERIKQFLNAELNDAFGSIDLSQKAKEAKKLITKEIGVQLDSKLSSLPEEFRNLKIEYGALSSIEEDTLKRLLVFERQNPEGLADILTKTQAAADLAFGGVRQKLQAVARLTIAKQLKLANDANELIRKAFEALTKTTSN